MHEDYNERIARLLELRRAFEAIATGDEEVTVRDAGAEEDGSAFDGGFAVRVGGRSVRYARLRFGPLSADLQVNKGDGVSFTHALRVYVVGPLTWNEFPFPAATELAASLVAEARGHLV